MELERGQELTSPSGIRKRVVEFYAKLYKCEFYAELYKCEFKGDKTVTQHFLDGLQPLSLQEL